MKLHTSVAATLFLYAFVLTGCGGDAASGGGPGGGPPGGAMPPMGVEVVTLVAKPIERTNEYVATVKSRRSTTIQPQVEGFVTRISVQPGQRVRAGTVLMQIDARTQQAAVASLEATRAARDADLRFARQQAERMKKLFEAGATSQQEYEQAVTTLQTTEAQIETIDALIRERRVELGYHNVTALTAGVVGDIPVRVGDRVTRATVLTTVDEHSDLELYINVPVQQAADLKSGLIVRIVDDAGKEVGSSKVNFVAPSVDPLMQSVLAKAPVQTGLALRPDQSVRVRMVWAQQPGLTVPLIAVTRINGQFFAFVAEKGEGGMTVARQRPLQLGPLVGNDYVLLSGLKEGEQLIVSGIQKIGDGAPVQATPAGAVPAPASSPARGTSPEAR